MNENTVKDIRQILEGDTEFAVKDTKSIFNIKPSLNRLVEKCSDNREIMDVLVEYNSKDNSDIRLIESFYNALQPYEVRSSAVLEERKKMRAVLESYRDIYAAERLIGGVGNDEYRTRLSEGFNRYYFHRNDKTRSGLYDVISEGLSAGEPVAQKMVALVESMESNFRNGKYKGIFEGSREDNRSEDDILTEKIARYVDKKVNESNKKDIKIGNGPKGLAAVANRNGIRLMESITNIRRKTDNVKLNAILEQYESALSQGAYEERLYETFLSKISNYDYLLPVETEMQRLNKRINHNKFSIDVTKILESMLETPSYYIVPLIEEEVTTYMKDKNPANKLVLESRIQNFIYDPYVRMIYDIVNDDRDIRAYQVNEGIVKHQDKMSFINENARLDNVYSPVQFVSEGVCVFNVGGKFYTKKGNNLTRLSESYLDKLSPKFVELSRMVNDPRVHVNEKSIEVKFGDNVAEIFEGYVTVNGEKESSKTIRNINEMMRKHDVYDPDFFAMSTCLLEYFNDIAKVGFVKHVALNENAALSADMFKLGNNIFIATHDNALNEHTFYRNVNPIQCKNILNEHMGMHIHVLFEDLLPDQDKVMRHINETQNEYENSIEKYEDIIDELKSTAENAEGEDKKRIEDAIKDTEKKLEDLKKEYKDWQADVDDAVKSGKDDETGKADKKGGDDEGGEDDENPDLISKEEAMDNIDELSQSLEDIADGGTGEPDVITDDTTIIGSDDENGLEDISGFEDIEGIDIPEENPEAKFDTNVNVGDSFKPENFSDEDFDDMYADIRKDIFDEEDTTIPDMTGDDFSLFPPEDKTGIDLPEPAEDSEARLDEKGYLVTRVSFDKDLATGDRLDTGSVNFIVKKLMNGEPSYEDGETVSQKPKNTKPYQHTSSVDVSFYIDEEGNVILDNVYEITPAMYQDAVAQVKESPDFILGEEDKESGEFPEDAVREFTFDDEETIDIPSYKNGDTEIEFPAKGEGDDTGIKDIPADSAKLDSEGPESFFDDAPITDERVEVKADLKNVEENPDDDTDPEGPNNGGGKPAPKGKKGAFLDVSSVVKNKATNESYHVSKEGVVRISKNTKAAKNSKKVVSGLNEARLIFDEYDDDVNDKEDLEVLSFDDVNPMDAFEHIHDNLLDMDDVEGAELEVGDIVEEDIPHFTVGNGDEEYTIYLVDDRVGYKTTEDFEDTIELADSDDVMDELAEDEIATVTDFETVMQELAPVVSSLTGVGVDFEDVEDRSWEDNDNLENPQDYGVDGVLNENVKIRKKGDPEKKKLDTDFDSSKSVAQDEAKYGTKDEKEFANELAGDAKNEAWKPKLPNFRLKVTEAQETVKPEPEPGMSVLYKGRKVTVQNVHPDGTVTILVSGMTVDVNKNQIELIPSNVGANTPKQFGDLDKKTGVMKDVEHKGAKHSYNLDPDRWLKCDLVVDNHKLNINECQVKEKDLFAGHSNVHVLNEYGIEEIVPVDNVAVYEMDPSEWPYAVVVGDPDGREIPEERVQINPKSYIECDGDDCEVECLVGDKVRTILKKYVRVAI